MTNNRLFKITLIATIFLLTIVLLLKLFVNFDLSGAQLTKSNNVNKQYTQAQERQSTQHVPKNDDITTNYTSSYFIKKHSYFEKQEKNQCGGYASAYVLRFMGQEIDGKSNYAQLEYKLFNGYVLPRAIIDVFAKHGFKSTLYHGDLKSLKTRLMQGIPIIVLVGQGLNWQHYITVVGFDEKNMYVYDSNMGTNNKKGYNRILSNSDFINIWENKIPTLERVYIVLES